MFEQSLRDQRFRLPLPEKLRKSRVVAFAAGCVLILWALSLTQPTGADQGQSQKPSTVKDTRYYLRILDETFFDVWRVVELRMDYALTYERKIEKEFLEWVAGRDMKDPEDNEYFKAMETLNQGWKLLLKSGTVYHEMRQRPTDDATTKRLHAEADQLYQQGVAKVKEAQAQRKIADDKRTARLEAQWAREQEQKAAEKERKLNEVKTTAGKFGQLNDGEEKENDLHNANIARISSTSTGKRRETLLVNESIRHERRMAEIDKKREQLANETDITRTPTRDWPDWKTSERDGGRTEPPDWRSASLDECFPLPAKKYEGCGADLTKENERWQREEFENKLAFDRENARSRRRLAAIADSKTPVRNPNQETECHAKNTRQLEAESDTLQERHLKCFARLMGR